MSNIKQIIVMRTHYPDGKGGERKVRTGKMIAQGAHASMGCLLKNKGLWHGYNNYADSPVDILPLNFTHDERSWIDGKFTKIVVGVRTEEELLSLHKKCEEAGILCCLIQDAGDTEFGGVPTHTALGIGPAKSEDVDIITGSLPLL